MKKQDLKRMEELLRETIEISLLNNWNIHSAVGGKYGEVFVANELRKHGPLIGKERKQLGKEVRNPTSADVILSRTKTKVEVKWGILHHRVDDYYFNSRGKTPYWGWGFSQGTQFLRDKFDYCVLLAAEKDKAVPKHIFVLTLQEMKDGMVLRVSGEGGKKKKSYFIETSDEDDFFAKREKVCGIKRITLEDRLLDRRGHIKRWNKLRERGQL